MELTQIQQMVLQEMFKDFDQQRLLFGPSDREALILFGVMAGMRETLEEKGITLPGVTGLWWYEKLPDIEGNIPGRELNTKEIVQQQGMTEETQWILEGAKKARTEVLRFLSLEEDETKQKLY